MKDLLLITPPFTQLNTPYPATAYIKGFLNTKNISAFQMDLGIEVILELFSKEGLESLFQVSGFKFQEFEPNSQRIYSLKNDYIKTIDSVIAFLQGKNPSLARQICSGNFLPEASRFAQLDDMEFAFGSMGMQDKAKHLATLYLEDLSDFIVECIDENFEISESTLQNIQLLKLSNTYTITTGHQLNLFTGPLYFLYKIASTINLCKELRQKYPTQNFVPIYWMATEDHDFDEINYFNFKSVAIFPFENYSPLIINSDTIKFF